MRGSDLLEPAAQIRLGVGQVLDYQHSIEVDNRKVWAVDFQFDATTDGRPIKIASIVDEHTRECLGGLVERNGDPTPDPANTETVVVRLLK
jgi:putative transposase